MRLLSGNSIDDFIIDDAAIAVVEVEVANSAAIAFVEERLLLSPAADLLDFGMTDLKRYCVVSMYNYVSQFSFNMLVDGGTGIWCERYIQRISRPPVKVEIIY
jgi:hypothetical protein